MKRIYSRVYGSEMLRNTAQKGGEDGAYYVFWFYGNGYPEPVVLTQEALDVGRGRGAKKAPMVPPPAPLSLFERAMRWVGWR